MKNRILFTILGSSLIIGTNGLIGLEKACQRRQPIRILHEFKKHWKHCIPVKPPQRVF